jgi:hypothetical protein
LAKLNDKFRKECPLTTSCRKVIEYLGITNDYRQCGKINSQRTNILRKVGGLPPDMQGTSKRPASSYLFTMNPESQQLDEEQGRMFYHLVTKLLKFIR